jgi:hypothetical protein
MKRLSLMATLSVIALTLGSGCAAKDALPYKGGGPIGTPKDKTDAAAKDVSPGGDASLAEAGTDAAPDAAPGDAATVGEGGSGTSCTMDCDCLQGEACFIATGTCTKESMPYYCCNKPGCVGTNLCTDHAGDPGTCGSSGFCLDQCDCPQGLTCTNSFCLISATKTYCCTKTGCPSGQACLNINGSAGICP